MKHAIELFSELGRRLERFGEDTASREVIARDYPQDVFTLVKVS